MSIVKSIRNLFFEPAQFFENYTKKGLGIPILITVIYGVLAAVYAFLSTMQKPAAMAMNIPGVSAEEIMPAIAGGSAFGAFFTAIIAWIAMSLLFFFALKIFCKPAPGFKDVLHITSFGAIPLAVSAIIEILISFAGTPNAWAILVLSAAVLFITIPIWVKGFEKIGAGPEKKILTAVIIACLIPVVISVVTTIMGTGA
ncbi:MAG TPA: YIP1 family protein [Methanocorpusculum sp.]|nr:YIP1 family protein [Methanocorpusculum sp.]